LVTIGLLFALKGGHFRAFYRWLKRDFDALFAGLPERLSSITSSPVSPHPGHDSNRKFDEYLRLNHT
jgi:hypothetical protein